MPLVRNMFSITHQLTSFQGLHQLSILTGENGPGQVQHHTHCREQHEKGYLEKNQAPCYYLLQEANKEKI